MFYIGSVWDPWRIRIDDYKVLKKYRIRTDLYYHLYRFRTGSVEDPYDNFWDFKKIHVHVCILLSYAICLM